MLTGKTGFTRPRPLVLGVRLILGTRGIVTTGMREKDVARQSSTATA
jgi:hypothetical protein